MLHDQRQEEARPATELPPDLRHIAIIMDGNRRWARRRALAVFSGHRRGSDAVRRTAEECARLGLEALTLYAFSTENWARPAPEVGALMDLLAEFLVKERPTILDNDMRFRVIGETAALPARVQDLAATLTEDSAGNGGTTLTIALSYGGRQEIVAAARRWQRDVAEGRADPDDLDPDRFARYLWNSDLPDPDLLIRTSGELRLSNFLLWQVAYTELYTTPVLWPDFDEAELHRAIEAYASRQRRYGAG